MSASVDRVALALSACGPSCSLESMARIAIAALREPTESQMRHVATALPGGLGVSITAYQAWIDAALAD